MANVHSYQTLQGQFSQLKLKMLFEVQEVLAETFDICVNLSLMESSWKLMEDIKASKRLGIFIQNGQVRVSDHWSTYLLTLKSPVPFLSFHLEEIYKNILGFKQAPVLNDESFTLRKFVFCISSSSIFPAGEQEALLNLLSKKYPGIPILDISETRPGDSDGVFYIGPAGLRPSTENFSRNLLIQKNFQGANILPTNATWVLTSQEKIFTAQDILLSLEVILKAQGKLPDEISLYRSRYSEEGDSFIERISGAEVTYPIYLAYYVLWSFVLGLNEFEPAFPKIDTAQKEFIQVYLGIIKKISRFHTYALASLDILLAEGKSLTPNSEIIDGHLENLRQIDETLRKISDSHSMLRPLLDFYHVRRGQNEGIHFQEQVENSLLIYHEEHQALTAFQELLETLEKR